MQESQQECDEAIAGFRAVLDACAGLPVEQQLTVPLIAWLTIADGARNGALSAPGGYEAERIRQLGYLERVVQLVRGASPDLELQRLHRVEGWTGALKHVRGLIAGVRDVHGAAPPKED